VAHSGRIAFDACVEIERNREVAFDELGYQSWVAATFVSDAMSYMVCVFTAGELAYVAQISEGMQRHLPAVTNGNCSARKGFILNRALDHLECGL